MSIIRYQTPRYMTFPAMNRWVDLRDELDNLFDLSASLGRNPQDQLFSAWTPALDLYHGKDNVTATVELPGMRKEDIEVSLHDGTLTISGERGSEKSEGENAERTERFSGKFRRSISLPTRVDGNKVSATYKDGILTVTLPKAEEAKPKQIQVNVG